MGLATVRSVQSVDRAIDDGFLAAWRLPLCCHWCEPRFLARNDDLSFPDSLAFAVTGAGEGDALRVSWAMTAWPHRTSLGKLYA